MNSSQDLNSIFNNNNVDFTQMGCVDKLNTGYFITLQGVEQETAVATQNKTAENTVKSYSCWSFNNCFLSYSQRHARIPNILLGNILCICVTTIVSIDKLILVRT